MKPNTSSTTSGSSGEVRVHFFGPDSFEWPDSYRARWRHWLLKFLLGAGPWHCVLDWSGRFWTCSPTVGCRSLKSYPGVPVSSYGVTPRPLGMDAWMNRKPFDYWQSVLDVLGFLPEKYRVMNCVQVIAVALGITQRLRTPRDLQTYLDTWSESWLIQSPQRSW